MIEEDTVVREAKYPHPVEAVWEAITDPAALAGWLMPNDFAPVVGHRFRFDARPEFGMIEAELVELDPPHLVRCRWTIEGVPTTVTMRLEPDEGGTVLRLEHTGLPPRPRTIFDGGWADKLAVELALVLDRTRDPARSHMLGGLHHHPDLGKDDP